MLKTLARAATECNFAHYLCFIDLLVSPSAVLDFQLGTHWDAAKFGSGLFWFFLFA